MVKPKGGPVRAYAYMRLSVDKEGGAPQSIDAQRSTIRTYAFKIGMVNGVAIGLPVKEGAVPIFDR